MRNELKKELENLREKALLREIKYFDFENTGAGRAIFNGKEYIFFCANDYLGLSRDPRLIRKGIEAIKKYGIGSGASRLISGSTVLHEELERKISRFKKKESAVTYSTGFMTNVGIITTLMTRDSLLIMDKLNHASIVDAGRLSSSDVRIYPHRNMKRLDDILKKNAYKYKRILIVSDSLFSMDGDFAPLEELVAIKEKYGAFLMIDEAHATGVFGSRGSGLAEKFNVENKVDIIMGTLSKTLGGMGGYVAASGDIIEYLKNKSRPFIYTTALSPFLCATAIEAIKIIDDSADKREYLLSIAEYARNYLKKEGVDIGGSESQIIPVITGSEREALKLCEKLMKYGFYVPAIRYPTVPRGRARLRISLSAVHKKSDLEELLKVIVKNYEKYGD